MSHEKQGNKDADKPEVSQETEGHTKALVVGNDGIIQMEAPENSTCVESLESGDVCGKTAKALVNNKPVCLTHLKFYMKPVALAKDEGKGRINKYGLIRMCKDCFALPGGKCPYGSEKDERGNDKLCTLEIGKLAEGDVKIDDVEDLTVILEGLLNDDLTRLERAKLLEYFDGGILDKDVDILTKRIRDAVLQVARVKKIISGEFDAGGTRPPIQRNFTQNIFKGMPDVPKDIVDAEDVEYEEDD